MDIIFYLIADDVNAKVVDLFGQAASDPTITRGLKPVLKLRPLHSDGTPFDVADLNFAAWDFILAHDWDPTTIGQIRTQTGITVVTVQVLVDDEEKDFAEIRIPLTDTNTTELLAQLLTKSDISLGAEIAGIPAGESDPEFVLQWNITVRNRRGEAGTGSPESVGDGNYTSSQVDALIAGNVGVRKRAVIAIADNTAAPPTEIAGDRYILDFTAGAVHADWDGANPGDIVEFKAEAWEPQTPSIGWVTYVTDDAEDAIYTNVGTPAWALRSSFAGGGSVDDSTSMMFGFMCK